MAILATKKLYSYKYILNVVDSEYHGWKFRFLSAKEKRHSENITKTFTFFAGKQVIFFYATAAVSGV